MPPKKKKKVKKLKPVLKQKQKQTQYVTVNVAGAQEKPKAKRQPRKKKEAVAAPFNAPRAGGGGGGGGGLLPQQEFRQVVFPPQDRSGDVEVRSAIGSLNQKISSLFNRPLGSEAPITEAGPAAGTPSIRGSETVSSFSRTNTASRAGSSPPVKPVVQRRGGSSTSSEMGSEDKQMRDRLGRAGILRTAQSKPFHQKSSEEEPSGVDSESMGVSRTERQKPMYAPYTTEPEKRRVKDATTIEQRDILEEEKIRKGGGRGLGKKTIKKELDRLLEADIREHIRQQDIQAAEETTAHFGQPSAPFEETGFM